MPPFAPFSPNSAEKQTLLDIARKNIESWVKFNCEYKPDSEFISENLHQKMSCFVTILKNDELRGCIGTLNAERELYLDVLKNSYSAAFKDFRFYPLSENELNDIHIEISILTPPERVFVNSEEELLSKLTFETGLVLKYKEYQATFLPSVWEKLPVKKEFLSQLKIKAGLDPVFYDPSMEFYFYEVVKIEEKKKS